MTLSPSPLDRAHDQSVTQRMTVPWRCNGLLWNGSPALNSSLRQSGAVRNTKRPLCKSTSGLNPFSLRPRATSFKQFGPATITTCWPISNPAITNCEISDEPFSFRTTKRHAVAWAASPAWLLSSTPIYSIFTEVRWACQQDLLAQSRIVPGAFYTLSPYLRVYKILNTARSCRGVPR